MIFRVGAAAGGGGILTLVQPLYCWRCQREVPMLDEEEFAIVSPHYEPGIRAVKDYRREHDVALQDVDRAACFRDMLDAYERITGSRERIPDVIMHHRLSLYGPPCVACGKPLRTPNARHCAACGANR